MTTPETATCQACGWHGLADDTRELRDVCDRVQPGDVMPAGECPLEGCRGAAMLDDRCGNQTDLQPVCNTCANTRVLVDAWAEWDTAAQRWKLHSTYEANAICAECDTECNYTMRALADPAA